MLKPLLLTFRGFPGETHTESEYCRRRKDVSVPRDVCSVIYPKSIHRVVPWEILRIQQWISSTLTYTKVSVYTVCERERKS